MVVKETESVAGMLLISPQAVMFEPTGYQSADAAPSADTDPDTAAGQCDESAARHDCIIVPMDSISSIMISHDCAAATVSTRSAGRHASAPACSENFSFNCFIRATQC